MSDTDAPLSCHMRGILRRSGRPTGMAFHTTGGRFYTAKHVINIAFTRGKRVFLFSALDSTSPNVIEVFRDKVFVAADPAVDYAYIETGVTTLRRFEIMPVRDDCKEAFVFSLTRDSDGSTLAQRSPLQLQEFNPLFPSYSCAADGGQYELGGPSMSMSYNSEHLRVSYSGAPVLQSNAAGNKFYIVLMHTAGLEASQFNAGALACTFDSVDYHCLGMEAHGCSTLRYGVSECKGVIRSAY